MKRYLAFLLAVSMMLGVCTFASAEEKVTLSALFYTNSLTKDVKELKFISDMAEAAGVNLEIEQVTSGWTEIKSTLLASGDLPDLIIGGTGILTSDIAQFQYLFQDLNELMEYAPNVARMFEEHPETKALSTSRDGGVYGLPKYQRYWPKSYLRQMINVQWLENLGLEKPTTLDELYNVLLAFKEQDANGNGDPNDEIPLEFAAGIAAKNLAQLPWIMAMTSGWGIPVTCITDEGWYLKEGIVGNVYMSEAYKELMVFISKCWSAGLINSEVFTQEYASSSALCRTGNVGFTFGWDITDRMGNDWAVQYETISTILPSAEYADKAVWEYSYYNLNYGFPQVTMSAACKNKEAAMRFVDLFYDPYYAIQCLFGSYGECIQQNEDGTLTVLPPADPTLDPGTWKWTNALADISPMYISDELQVTLPSDMQLIDSLSACFEEQIARVGNDGWPGVFLSYEDEVNAELSYFMTDLKNIWEIQFAEWTTNGGVAEGWDAYINSANNAGFEEARQIVQTAVDAYLGK
ncbi:MAG: extracellular solute-binding protein [Faecousia sp.]